MKSPRPICPSWLRTCYRFSLRVYPAQFRAEYGALMEQAFADRYASFTASGKMSEKIHFALDTLRDSGQSLCSQHWHATEATGFVRQRFLMLLLLFVPVIIFHQNLITKATQGMEAIDAAMDNAMYKEFKTYNSKLEARLRQNGDADSLLAAHYLGGQWTTEDLPEGEAANRMNLRIAHEIMAYPFKPSLLARLSERQENWTWSDADTLMNTIWNYDNIRQIKACKKLENYGDNEPTCQHAWHDHQQNMQFGRVLNKQLDHRPKADEIVAALELNRMNELKLKYIALNNLQSCQLTEARNDLECDDSVSR